VTLEPACMWVDTERLPLAGRGPGTREHLTLDPHVRGRNQTRARAGSSPGWSGSASGRRNTNTAVVRRWATRHRCRPLILHPRRGARYSPAQSYSPGDIRMKKKKKHAWASHMEIHFWIRGTDAGKTFHSGPEMTFWWRRSRHDP